jgi:hypothetical protein
MCEAADEKGVERRVFRKHWFFRLATPGFPWLVATVLSSLAVLYSLHHVGYVLGFCAVAVLPFLKLLQLIFAWLGYSVSATAGSNVLTERSGFLNVTERLIPMTQIASIEYKKPWWATLLHIDVANVSVGSVDDQYLLSFMGDFRDLWQVLQSRGDIVPRRRASTSVTLLGALWRSLHFLVCLAIGGVMLAVSRLVASGSSVADQVAGKLRELTYQASDLLDPHRHCEPISTFGLAVNRSPADARVEDGCPSLAFVSSGVNDGDYVYKGLYFSHHVATNVGFYAFCEQFILMNKNWEKHHYNSSDKSRRYYPCGISEQIAHYYLEMLRNAHILIPGPNGCSGERVSCRIRCIEDIEELVPDISHV